MRNLDSKLRESLYSVHVGYSAADIICIYEGLKPSEALWIRSDGSYGSVRTLDDLKTEESKPVDERDFFVDFIFHEQHFLGPNVLSFKYQDSLKTYVLQDSNDTSEVDPRFIN